MSHRKSKKDQTQDKSWWDNLDRKTKHAVCLAILFITPFFIFPEVVFEGKKFFAHDEIQFLAGSKTISDYREANNEEPLWAPNMFSGMPAFLISYAKSVPHLDQLVRTALPGMFPISMFWSALFGGYFFFFLLARSHVGAAFASVSASYTTYLPIIVGAGHNTKILAFSLIGWVLGFLILVFKSKKPLLHSAAFSIALAVQLRANHPQVTYYFAFLGLAITLYYAWTYIQENRNSELYQRLALIVGAAVLALAVIVQPYWATFEYSKYSIRGGSDLSEDSGLDQDYAMAWSQGWTELTTLISPAFMGGSSAEGTYWGPKSFTSGPHYLGVLTFLMAVIALFLSKRRIKYALLVVSALSILFSLGENFSLFNSLFFNYFPLFNKFRTPEMWLLLTAFSISGLAALGLAFIEEQRPKLSELKVPLLVVFSLAAILFISSKSLISFEKDGERIQMMRQVAARNGVAPSNPQVQQMISRYMNNQIIPERMEKSQADTIRLITYLAVGAVTIFVVNKFVGLSAITLLLLVFVNLIDMGSIGRRYLNTESMIPKTVENSNALEKYKRPVDKWIQQRIVADNGVAYRVFPLDTNPFNSATTSAFYPSIGGYSGAKMNIYQDLIENGLYTDEGLNDSVIDMLNVKYITSSGNIPGNYTPVYSSDGSVVLENPDVLPKAYLVGDVHYASDSKSAISMISTFNPAKVAIIESEMPFDISPDSLSQAEVTKYSEREIVIETQSATNQLLVVSEIYYPVGWKAEIDGSKAEIIKTNYVLRGIPVPSGKHTISLTFAPTSHVWGSRIAWTASVLQILLLGFAFVFYNRKDESES